MSLSEANKKTCPTCDQLRSLGDFYEIRAKGGCIRFEKKCKFCKRKYRQGKLARQNCNHGSIKLNYTRNSKTNLNQLKQASRIIEPRIHETEMLSQVIDFTATYTASGALLTFQDKCNAVQRFNEFVSILREEYSGIIGCNVYVKAE